MATVVLEFAEDCIKYGLSGDANARYFDPSSYEVKNSSENLSVNWYLDEKMRLTTILHTIFIDKLCIVPKDCRLVVVENIFELKSRRDILLTNLFVQFSFLEISIQPDLFLPILTSFELSGTIIYVCEEETRVVAIWQGRPLIHTLKCKHFKITIYFRPYY